MAAKCDEFCASYNICVARNANQKTEAIPAPQIYIGNNIIEVTKFFKKS